MAMRIAIVLVSSIALVGCFRSHGTFSSVASIDGGPLVSTSCGGPRPFCILISGHVCGDGAMQATCSPSGAWQCPPGWVLDDGTPECWCHGPGPLGCTCTPAGWFCSLGDAGLTAECPIDLPAAVGHPCAIERQTCGTCDPPPCGRCEQIVCLGGRWGAVDADARPRPPPETEPCNPQFACGATTCTAHEQFCLNNPIDDSFQCLSLPAGCDNCPCLEPWVACTVDSVGGITISRRTR